MARVLLSTALMFSTPLVAMASAQGNGRITVSLGSTTSLTAPGGTEIESAATQSVTVTATLTDCSHFPCTIYLKTNQAAVTAPGSAITALDYCLTNCGVAANWTAVPNAANEGQQIASLSTNTSVTFQLRYRLGWAGSPFSPPGSYSLPIFISLKN
jgi:hypothetical protein